MALGDRINAIRKEKRMSIDDLCALSGVPKGTLSKITANITTNPTLDTIQAIAKALECRLDDFDDNPRLLQKAMPLPDEALRIAYDYDDLDPHGKRMVRVVIDEEMNRMSEKAKSPYLEVVRPPEDDDEIPAYEVLFGVAAAAEGSGAELDDFDGHVTVTANDETRQADLVIKVEGRSMEPDYHDGEYVLVRLQPEVEIGEVGVWMIDGRGYIKERGRNRLISRNPDVPDVRINEQDCRCIGKVIGELDPDMILE